MRNIFKLSLLIVLTVLGCTKKNSDFQNKPELLTEIKNMEFQPLAQRLSYNMLTKDEKKEIWSKQIGFVSSLSELNIEQSKKLNELKELVATIDFSNEFINRNHDLAVTLNDWKIDALKIFGKSLLKQIVAEVHTNDYLLQIVKLYTKNKDISTQRPPSPGGNCTCNINSDWCSTACWPTSCKRSEIGCGTLFLSPCDGKCAVGPPEN